MKIAIGCDHGGLPLKESCIKALNELGFEYIDCGTYTPDSVDYPDYAAKVCEKILNKEADKGILLCGTGIGIGVAANKFKGIFCAHITDKFSAQMASEHNNANIISMGARITSNEDAYEFVKIFFTTPFAGGRHCNRLEKIAEIENKNFK
ncbi:MAG: ribose 5-phosphate isomerase B [Clostridia bacterium]|nr:ribose 5-phosphate isomerase B [Clostridia bacterium]